MILNRCTCEETQAATGTHGPCSFCHAGGGEGPAPLTDDEYYERQAAGLIGSGAPLDLEAIKERLALAAGAWAVNVARVEMDVTLQEIAKVDVPALVAEVERLDRALSESVEVSRRLAYKVTGSEADPEGPGPSQMARERDEARAIIAKAHALVYDDGPNRIGVYVQLCNLLDDAMPAPAGN